MSGLWGRMLVAALAMSVAACAPTTAPEPGAARLANASPAAVAVAAPSPLATVRWPAPPSEWRTIQTALQQARTVPGTENEVRALEAQMRAGAADAFARYALLTEPNFFSSYPVALDVAQFHRDNADAAARYVAFATSAELAEVHARYRDHLPNAARTELVTRHAALAAAEIAAARQRGTVAAARANGEVQAKARAAGLPMGASAAAPLTLVDLIATAPTQRGGFPMALAANDGFPAERASLDLALSTPGNGLLVVVAPGAARVTRTASNREAIDSEYKAGVRTVPNIEFQIAEVNLLRARQAVEREEVGQARLINLLGAFAPTTEGLAKARKEYDDALLTLGRTPQQVDEPVWRSYRFWRGTIGVQKAGMVAFHVLDRAGNAYFTGALDLRESRDFRLVYDLHADDRNRTQHLAGTGTERDVTAFEDAVVTVSLADVLRAAEAMTPRPMPSAAELRAALTAAPAVANTAAPRAAAPATGDRRFGSVVAIETPTGSGSGFYVAPDLVLTNFHVIEGSRLVTVKQLSGADSVGRVIAEDSLRDLALVAVQTRGEPVLFRSEAALPVGATVEAIGHPKGLDYSLTRGVVSAVRDMEAAGVTAGPRVRYLQTDTAINPGNSGGPLFLGDRVVGVNTWGLRETQGLSFAIHYAEVFDFLRRNQVEPRI